MKIIKKLGISLTILLIGAASSFLYSMKKPVPGSNSSKIREQFTYRVVQHKDNRFDFFDINSNKKVNKTPIKADSSKTIARIRTYQNRFLILYTDRTGDLFTIDTGEKIKSFQIIGKEYHHFLIQHQDKTVDLFNINSGRATNRAPIKPDPNKTIVCTGTYPHQLLIQYKDNTLDLFNLNTGERINRTPIKADPSKTIFIHKVQFKYLILQYKDKTVDLFDINTGEKINQTTIKTHVTKTIDRIRTYQNRFLVLYTDKTGDLFTMDIGEKIKSFQIIQKKPDHLIIQHTDKTVDLFNIKTGRATNRAPIKPDPNKTIFLTWSFSNKLLIQYKDKTADLFDINTGNRFNNAPIVTDTTKIIASTCTYQNHLFIQYADKTGVLFNINTGEKINRALIVTNIAKTIVSTWTCQNQLFILYKDHTGDLYSMTAGKKIKSFQIGVYRQYFIVQYNDNKTVDLFDNHLNKLNLAPIKADQRKTIIDLWSVSNRLLIQYTDKTADLFDINTGNKLNNAPIVTDATKTIARTWKYQNQFFILYQDNTGDLYSMTTGKKIKSFQIGVYRQYFIVQYKDNKTVDLFDNHLNKLNRNPIETDLNKTIAETKIVANNIFIITYSDNTWYLFNISSEKPIDLGTIEHENILYIDSTPYSNKILFIGYHNRLTHRKTVDFFNLESNCKINSIPVQSKEVSEIKVKHNLIFCITYIDNACEIFNIKSGEQVTSFALKSKNQLLSMNENNEITVFNTKSGNQINQPIKLDKKKTIDLGTIDIIKNKILFIKDSENNSVNLFHMPLHKKLNPSKNIRSFNLSKDGNSISLIYTDNTMDLVAIDSAKKINQKPIKLQKNKRINYCSLHEDKKDPGKKYLCIAYTKNESTRHSLHFFAIPSGEPIRKQEITKIIASDRK